MDDKVRQRNMTLPGHEGICKPERSVCNISAMELSTFYYYYYYYSTTTTTIFAAAAAAFAVVFLPCYAMPMFILAISLQMSSEYLPKIDERCKSTTVDGATE